MKTFILFFIFDFCLILEAKIMSKVDLGTFGGSVGMENLAYPLELFDYQELEYDCSSSKKNCSVQVAFQKELDSAEIKKTIVQLKKTFSKLDKILTEEILKIPGKNLQNEWLEVFGENLPRRELLNYFTSEYPPLVTFNNIEIGNKGEIKLAFLRLDFMLPLLDIKISKELGASSAEPNFMTSLGLDKNNFRPYEMDSAFGVVSAKNVADGSSIERARMLKRKLKGQGFHFYLIYGLLDDQTMISTRQSFVEVLFDPKASLDNFITQYQFEGFDESCQSKIYKDEGIRKKINTLFKPEDEICKEAEKSCVLKASFKNFKVTNGIQNEADSNMLRLEFNFDFGINQSANLEVSDLQKTKIRKHQTDSKNEVFNSTNFNFDSGHFNEILNGKKLESKNYQALFHQIEVRSKGIEACDSIIQKFSEQLKIYETSNGQKKEASILEVFNSEIDTSKDDIFIEQHNSLIGSYQENAQVAIERVNNNGLNVENQNEIMNEVFDIQNLNNSDIQALAWIQELVRVVSFAQMKMASQQRKNFVSLLIQEVLKSNYRDRIFKAMLPSNFTNIPNSFFSNCSEPQEKDSKNFKECEATSELRNFFPGLLSDLVFVQNLTYPKLLDLDGMDFIYRIGGKIRYLKELEKYPSQFNFNLNDLQIIPSIQSISKNNVVVKANTKNNKNEKKSVVPEKNADPFVFKLLTEINPLTSSGKIEAKGTAQKTNLLLLPYDYPDMVSVDNKTYFNFLKFSDLSTLQDNDHDSLWLGTSNSPLLGTYSKRIDALLAMIFNYYRFFEADNKSDTSVTNKMVFVHYGK